MLMIFLKKLSDVESGIKAVFRSGKQSVVLYGNIPEMKVGMAIDITSQAGEITDYSVPASARNVKLLGAKADDFFSNIQIHKTSGFRWRDLAHLDNPYVCYPFAEADKLFCATGKTADDTIRLHGIISSVQTALREKRQWQIDISRYIDLFREIESTGAYPPLPDATVVKCIRDERFDFGNGMICDSEIRMARDYRKRNIAYRNAKKTSLLSEQKIEAYLAEDTDRTEEQKRIVMSLRDSRPTIVTGGAGVGKTTSEKAIIECWSRYRDKDDICLLAPTGRAARRMHECTGIEAKTIHSGLRKTPDSEYIYYGESRKLPYKLYIVDETSMVDDLLMTDLLKAIPEDAKIYLVGDSNQLYPVGVGEPFHEMIANGEVEVVTLTRNFRQASEEGVGIRENANAILLDNPLSSREGFEIHRINKRDILLYVDAVTPTISPFNSLNDEINRYVIGQRVDEKHLFFAGEKVLATKNTGAYCNGDIGKVLELHRDEVVIDFDGQTVRVPRKEFCNIMPAYSMTVHKCQGSEFDKINLFLPAKANEFITKRLVYTAITRAKKHVNLYMYD